MDEVKQYKTAGAFRTALETRLQTRAQVERTDLQRLRRQVAFDRFLARLFPKGPKGTYPWILKGGYAMELRIRSARTTRLAAAIKATFAKRATHPVPQKLEQPPSEWEPVFQAASPGM